MIKRIFSIMLLSCGFAQIIHPLMTFEQAQIVAEQDRIEAERRAEQRRQAEELAEQKRYQQQRYMIQLALDPRSGIIDMEIRERDQLKGYKINEDLLLNTQEKDRLLAARQLGSRTPPVQDSSLRPRRIHEAQFGAPRKKRRNHDSDFE